MKYSKHIYFVKNAMNTSEFGLHDVIVSFIKNKTPIPEAFSDLIKIDLVEVDDGIRGIVDWA